MIGFQMGPGETHDDYALVHGHSVPRAELPSHVVGHTVIHEHPFGPGHIQGPPHPLPGYEESES